MWCVLLLVCALGAVPVAMAGDHAVIEFHGNVLFNDETYRAVLQLSALDLDEPSSPERIARLLEKFLHHAGYVLARVKAESDDRVFQIHIDEGRLEKVVFLGCGSLKALQLKLKLDLPYQVFNRPFLRRQLKQWQRDHDLDYVTYKLVPVGKVDHTGPQFVELGSIQGREVIPPPGKYELHVILGRPGWGTGVGLELAYDFPDGLEIGSDYRGRGGVLRSDRWQVGGKVGGKFRERLDDHDPYLALSRAQVKLRWYSPGLFGTELRPYLQAGSDLISRQRSDMALEIYYREILEGSLNANYRLDWGLGLSLGGGVQEKWIFGSQIVGDVDEPSVDSRWFRPFVSAMVDWVFEPDLLRTDRRHRIQLEFRHFWPEALNMLGTLRLKYRKLFSWGWNDLIFNVRGAWLWGDVAFDDQEPVGGRYLRGVFGDRYHVHRVINWTVEFRFSLARDLLKIGLFHDLAFFGQLPEASQGSAAGESLRVANSLGPGFHMLLLDAFQLDVYFGVGFCSEEQMDYGLSVKLHKVF